MLLGLLREGEGIAAKVLSQLDPPLTLDRTRKDLFDSVRVETSAMFLGHLPFDRCGKKVLELSLREALQMSHSYIGTEHLLLALIRSEFLKPFFLDCRLDLSAARKTVVAITKPEATPPAPASEAWTLAVEVLDHLIAQTIEQLNGLHAARATAQHKLSAIQ